ncbi:hypothetical protein H2200_010817 [Cladophialophora chaetospira]|uniref:Acetyl-CoA synthetase-like protein n=1 Tax=Cladophialophora chaetospira TaxID=386627 RepID=A0AA39CDW3_9EURO|nr:hypothetical protein H2200_010817 [Cladophialophora chaetospira]
MPTTSSYPPLDIPNVNLWSFLFSRSDQPYPDAKVLFSDAEAPRAYTYHAVRDATIKFGSGLLAEYDWKKGDVVALFSPNDVDYPLVMLGTLWAGGIVSLVNSSYTASELEFQLVDSAAKLLVTHMALLPIVLVAAKKLGFLLSKILLLGDEDFVRASGLKHFKSLRGLGHSTIPYSIDPYNDTCCLIYSSGTTGKPKGVMLTHRNFVSNTLMLVQSENGNLSWKGGPNGRGDSIIGFLPFFHSYGLTGVVLYSFYVGAEVIVMQKFDLEKYCEITERRKVTVAMVVPPVVLLLGKSPIVDRYDLSSLRLLTSGAAPLTRELVNIVQKRLNATVRQGYGLSETSPVIYQQTWESLGEPVGSIGTLLANQVAKFVSPAGEEVPINEVGELWMKGPNVFKGYLNNPVKTTEAFSEDGYFKTGDIGYQDACGNVFITDRSKELIKYNAFQVAPAELEGVLMSHPKVADAAVVGVQDDQRATEVPRAYLVVGPGVKATEETAREIQTWMKEKVASHKQLRGGIRFIDAVPKSAAGKILRTKVRELAKTEDGSLLQSKL